MGWRGRELEHRGKKKVEDRRNGEGESGSGEEVERSSQQHGPVTAPASTLFGQLNDKASMRCTVDHIFKMAFSRLLSPLRFTPVLSGYVSRLSAGTFNIPTLYRADKTRILCTNFLHRTEL